MGEMYIYDIVGHHLPHRLIRSMNIAKLLTGQTNYEIMVAALERYFKELGIGEYAEHMELNGSSPDSSFQPRETDGFKYLYQRVRIKSPVEKNLL
ncbi:MAG: hypothetical protein K6T66_10465 [Peptococcaceae bacterium]|nr:hypothetical protein [Peptococcaceae bacterium]